MNTYDFIGMTFIYLVVTSIIATAFYFILGKPPIIECIIAGGIIGLALEHLSLVKDF